MCPVNRVSQNQFTGYLTQTISHRHNWVIYFASWLSSHASCCSCTKDKVDEWCQICFPEKTNHCWVLTGGACTSPDDDHNTKNAGFGFTPLRTHNFSVTYVSTNIWISTPSAWTSTSSLLTPPPHRPPPRVHLQQQRREREMRRQQEREQRRREQEEKRRVEEMERRRKEEEERRRVEEEKRRADREQVRGRITQWKVFCC